MLAGTSVRWKGMCLHAEFAEVLQSLRENGHEVLPLFLPDEASLIYSKAMQSILPNPGVHLGQVIVINSC